MSETPLRADRICRTRRSVDRSARKAAVWSVEIVRMRLSRRLDAERLGDGDDLGALTLNRGGELLCSAATRRLRGRAIKKPGAACRPGFWRSFGEYPFLEDSRYRSPSLGLPKRGKNAKIVPVRSSFGGSRLCLFSLLELLSSPSQCLLRLFLVQLLYPSSQNCCAAQKA